jgi:ligand-binding sensor domain-containing protein
VSGLVVSAALLGAQPPTGLTLPPVERLGTEHGLSHNSVYAVLEDRQGFLWFGTQSGLNRFDGRDFVVFGHDPNDPRSLGSSWIHTLLEDRSGRLLVGTRAGLYRLADDGVGFERIPLVADGSADPDVTALAETPDGTLWVGAGNALFHVDPGPGAVTAIDPVTGAGAWGRVRHLRLMPDGTVWALEENEHGQVSLIRATPPAARYDLPYAWAFVMSDAGEIWLDPRRPLPASALESVPVPAIDGIFTAALADTRDRLWVGTLAGLFVRAAAAAPLEPVPLDHLGLGALTHEITTIVEDRVGTIWLGTFGGVLRFDPHRKAFAQFVHREGDPATLASNAVSSVHLADTGTLYVGTYGAGLDAIDRATGRIEHHRHRTSDPASLCDDYIWDLAPSRHVTLWIGLPGMFCSYAEGRFRRYAIPAAAANVLAVRETGDGSVWLGTSGGLYRYDRIRDRVELIGNAATGLLQPIDAMREDRDGRLWLGSVSTGSLAWIDPTSRASQVFRGVGREGVWDFAWDAVGEMWLATGVGPASFDTASGRSTYAALPAGIAPAVYYSVLADDAGRLWLGTSRGLVRYDPASGEFRSYPGGTGPGHVEFNRHAGHRAASGELFFGGMSGLTSFMPDRIADNPYRPPVVLTGVRAFGDQGERRLRPVADGLTLMPQDRSVCRVRGAQLHRGCAEPLRLPARWLRRGVDRRRRRADGALHEPAARPLRAARAWLEQRRRVERSRGGAGGDGAAAVLADVVVPGGGAAGDDRVADRGAPAAHGASPGPRAAASADRQRPARRAGKRVVGHCAGERDRGAAARAERSRSLAADRRERVGAQGDGRAARHHLVHQPGPRHDRVDGAAHAVGGAHAAGGHHA